MSDRLLVTLPSIALATVAGLGVAQKLTTLNVVNAEEVPVAINAESLLNVELVGGPVQLSIIPTAAGKFGKESIDIKVSTNNETGYNLTVQADESDLVNSEAGDAKIESIASDVTCSSADSCDEMGDNKWGYSIDGTKYLTVTDAIDGPKGLDSIDTAPEGVRTTTVYFGARLNNTIPMGTYDGVTLTFVATANPLVTLPSTNITGIEYMQQINATNKASVLESMAEDQQYTIKDQRDGKTYWVAKLKDGNIWMTQNLDLNLTKGQTLTPADTDVKSNWVVGDGLDGSKGTTYTSSQVSSWQNDNTYPQSFDPGDIYWDNTTDVTSTCDYLTNGTKEKESGGCTAFSTSPFASNDTHGHVGNYYSWTAAVASNSNPSVNTDYAQVDTSICPAGWRLPKMTADTVAANEFRALAKAYGAAPESGNGSSDAGLIGSPLYFVRGGNVNSGALNNAGGNGYYWSNASYSNGTQARYLLFFYSTSVNPASYSSRYYGWSVRCVVR